jgi:predicted ribosome quality control (RQC) complex YloA/Tae2 family protein
VSPPGRRRQWRSNEFLKEHKKVEEQQAKIAELKSIFAQQQKDFESKLAKQEEQIEAYGGPAESERTARHGECVPGGLGNRKQGANN